MKEILKSWLFEFNFENKNMFGKIVFVLFFPIYLLIVFIIMLFILTPITIMNIDWNSVFAK
jgi:hypothetical protein